MTRQPSLPRSAGARASQRGATLIIGLIMIVLITLIVVNAFMLSSSNLKSVGNMQVREEAIAAGNQVIESIIGSPFTDNPQPAQTPVDINNDGTPDYVVDVLKPTCIRAGAATAAAPSDVELGADMSVGQTWNTDWHIAATVTDASSGAAVRIREGVRVLLTQAQKTAVCD